VEPGGLDHAWLAVDGFAETAADLRPGAEIHARVGKATGMGWVGMAQGKLMTPSSPATCTAAR
jgi:hypothetical protein